MDYLIYFVLLSEYIAAISATIFFFKYGKTPLKWILPLLWYIAINETLSQFIINRGDHHIFYNIYELIVSISILTICRMQLNSLTRRRVTLILIILSALSFLVNFLMIDPLSERTTFAFTVSTMLIVVALLHYLIEHLKSDSVVNVSRDLFLWVCSGFLVFHLAYPVIRLTGDYVSRSLNFTGWNALYIIQASVVIVSYSLIGFGFYYGEKIESVKLNMK